MWGVVYEIVKDDVELVRVYLDYREKGGYLLVIELFYFDDDILELF